MNLYDATEEAYKNGYEKGKQDAMKQCAITREKLIELLEQINGCCPKEDDCYHCPYEPMDDCSVYAKADFLIASGVVISKKETPTTNADRCVCCGAIIPDGQMVCPNCLVTVKEGKTMLKAVYNYPENGYHPIDELEVGKEYTVEDVSMGGSYTSIYLEEVSGCFNSVNFDFFKDGKPHDIYADPDYNPYIRRIGNG